MIRLRPVLLSALVVPAVLAGAFASAAPDMPRAWRSDLSPTERAAISAQVKPATNFAASEPDEALSAGAATSIDPVDRNAFAHMTGNLPAEEEMRFHLGRALFRKLWVAAPSSTQASDGLGPLFNARSCESCHQRDGRGRPPQADGGIGSLILRLARPPRTPAERQAIAGHVTSGLPDPVYGTQLQDRAIPGLAAEGKVTVSHEELPVSLGDGERVFLQKPSYRIDGLAYGPLAEGTTVSPRLAPPMVGLGLIEAIHEGDILANEDADDRDGDGISGRAAYVAGNAPGSKRLGRFGWKAEKATVREQTAAALAMDIGISSPLADLPHGDCTAAETACLALPTGVQKRLGPTEAPGPVLDLITFYAENLAVPARRRASFGEVLAGKQVFHQLGCPACHVPKYVTRKDAALTALGGQLVWPYSDFLLHDMGEGLADGQPVGSASGSEWKTPPLWGLGLSKTVNGNGYYLHDGRARSLTEAILWHGGEGQKAREAFRSAPAADRQSLMKFLESL